MGKKAKKGAKQASQSAARTHLRARQRKNQGEGKEGEVEQKGKKRKKAQNPVSSIVPRPNPPEAFPLPLAVPLPPASEGSSMYWLRIERTSAAIAARMRAL